MSQVRDQSNQLSKLHAESQLLESSLQESQRQAMALGTRLSLTENKNDELLSQTQVGADWGPCEAMAGAHSGCGRTPGDWCLVGQTAWQAVSPATMCC